MGEQSWKPNKIMLLPSWKKMPTVTKLNELGAEVSRLCADGPHSSTGSELPTVRGGRS
jgi:hypothetical protein